MHQEPSSPFCDPVASAPPQAALGTPSGVWLCRRLQVLDVCSLCRTRAVSTAAVRVATQRPVPPGLGDLLFSCGRNGSLAHSSWGLLEWPVVVKPPMTHQPPERGAGTHRKNPSALASVPGLQECGEPWLLSLRILIQTHCKMKHASVNSLP